MIKILLVEDNEMNRDIVMRGLSRSYEVVVASNGKEALEMVAAELPDLILMDLSLPEINGWEATRLLKKNEATQGIPVIALTAHGLKSDREKGLAAGCDDYEIKPVDLRRLMEKIERLLGNKESS
jgi:two-component system, cell cycle response regulator DivK